MGQILNTEPTLIKSKVKSEDMYYKLKCRPNCHF